MESLNLSIVTPYGRIYEGKAKSVVVPGSDGEMGIMPGHCELISTLKAGVIEFEKDDGEKELVAINWGHVKIDAAGVDILADGAVAIGGKDNEVSKALEAAKKLLQDATDDKVALGGVISRLENSK